MIRALNLVLRFLTKQPLRCAIRIRITARSDYRLCSFHRIAELTAKAAELQKSSGSDADGIGEFKAYFLGKLKGTPL